MITMRSIRFPSLLILFGWLQGLILLSDAAQDLSKFLYLQERPEDVYPIQEYPRDDEDYNDKPDFLYSQQYPNPRIVEYYAHWCPHCQHFKPHFIEFAKKMQEVTQQLSDKNNNIQVESFAVSCVIHPRICKEKGIHGYPSLRLYPAHSINATNLNQSRLHPKQILKQLGIEVDEYSSEAIQPDGQGKNALAADQKVQQQHFLKRSKKEIYEDAHLSLDFLLRNGVFTALGPLERAPRQTLIRFVSDILIKALPISSSLYSMVQGLHESSLEDITTSEEKLLEVLDQNDPPTSQTWSPACRQHGTGYTCGLWTLFHIITVGTVEWNIGTADPESRLSTVEVADSIRNVIEHFFQCDECRLHFLGEYDVCKYDRCNRLTTNVKDSTFDEWKELPLWLYETHNGVNTRLRQERIENHEPEDTTNEWQVQWPAVIDCPKCWLSQGRWDENQVYRFLRLQYWPSDYRTSDFQKHLDHASKEYLHPDIIKEMKTGQTGLDSPHSPLPLMAIALFSVVSGYMWFRKRRLFASGAHKECDQAVVPL